MQASTLRAVVHIGPVKTGSSALNRLMTALRDRNQLPDGLIFPDTKSVLMPGGETVTVNPRDIRFLSPALAWDRQTGETKTKTHEAGRLKALSRFDRYLEVVAAEARATGGEVTVLFIQEVVARLPRPKDVVENLLRHFDRVDLFFVARRQRFIVPSAITQRVKQAYFPSVQSASVDDFLHNLNLKTQFDYDALYSRWSFKQKNTSVTVVPFLESDRGTDKLFRRIGDTLGFKLPAQLPVVPSNNETPNRATLRASMWFKRNVARKNAKNGGAFYLATYWPVMNTIRAISKLWGSPRWTFTTNELQKIDKAYQPNNEAFRKQLRTLAASKDWQEWFGSEKVGAK